MSSQRRSFVFIPLFIGVSALVGGLFGPGSRTVAAAQQHDSSDDNSLKSDVDAFSKVYYAVEQNYADKLSADKAIYRGAIPGALRTLDPHSNFFDPKEFAGMQEEQQGRYYGIGMRIGQQPRTGKTIVIAPFGGSPAYKAGLRPGDILYEINGKNVENNTSTEIADMLKGPKGTNVSVTILRESAPKPITFNLIRDEIPQNTVDEAFWVRPGIAYVKIKSFTSESTAQELQDNLKRLGEQNINGLILDLRDNPGGILNEGVAVAGHFLERGQVIVSHKGRVFSEKPYMARGSEYGLKYAMVVLVNRYSASAAEIVAGALQDHDRALILGDTTFGKGLVQTVYRIADNTGLALTTQHYYTPSGRLIQRNYSNISFLDYYYGRRGDAKNPTDVKQTDIGRVVYGGGGITPDVKYDLPKPDAFEIDILTHQAFFDYSAHWFATHSDKLPAGWSPDENVLNDFHYYLMSHGVQFTEADWTRDHDWIRNQLKQQMYIAGFSYEDSLKVEVLQDPEVTKAIDVMSQAGDLLAQSKQKVLKQRAMAQ